MEASKPVRILVVNDHTTATPALLDAIRERAQAGPTRFRMLVPNPAEADWHPLHPQRHQKADEAERVLARGLPAVEEAAGGAVIGSVSIRHDPMDAIEETLHDEPIDEIILSDVEHSSIARWLHVDLPDRVAHLGLPLTTVTEEPEDIERGS